MTDFADTDIQPTQGSPAWLWILARTYDPFLWLGELSGMRQRRRTLLRSARCRVVEIGAGTGLNLAHYPEDVTELVLVEPEPSMRKRLVKRLRRHSHPARVVDASAERLPPGAQRFDDYPSAEPSESVPTGADEPATGWRCSRRPRHCGRR